LALEYFLYISELFYFILQYTKQKTASYSKATDNILQYKEQLTVLYSIKTADITLAAGIYRKHIGHY
jgi:hypothetical protein